MAKTLYHSEFVKMGPVLVTVKSDVLPSKFPDKPEYVVLEIEGEERNYSTENEECAEFFRDQKGRRFTLVAEGTRDNAVLTYVGEAPVEGAAEAEPEKEKKTPTRAPKSNRPPSKPPGRKGPPPAQESERAPAPTQSAPPANRPAPTQGQGQRPPAPPAKTPEQRLTDAKLHANKVANLWLIAYSAGQYVRAQVQEQFGHAIPEAQLQACVSSICIQLAKDGFQSAMPVGIINVAPKQPAPADAPKDPSGATTTKQ